MGIDVRRQVRQYVERFPSTYDPATVRLPADGSAPQPIVPVVDGLACRGCAFKSTNRAVMRKHANQAHDQRRVVDADIFAAVRLQSWFGEKRERYWTVEEDDHHQRVVRERQAMQEDADEESDGPEPQERPGLGQGQCTPDTALYVQRTDWLATFAELQHWRATRELTYLPKAFARGYM